MEKLISAGRIMFALCIIALGALQFFAGDFIVGRPPAAGWASSIPGKLVWAYASAILLIAMGICILLNKKASAASVALALFIFVFSFLARHLPQMFSVHSPEDVLWQINAYKTLALCGGALIISDSFIIQQHSHLDKFFINTGCIFLALFFVISGCAHFKFDAFIINSFIPAYIPAHPFWTYFCGVALITAGIGILINQTRKLAAIFAGVMILVWFLLLHIPRAYAAPHDYSEWMGVFESFGFSGILFTLAGRSSKHFFPKVIN
jgi:uncharacterized membrane protein YphA (DoxX/SURF4 family)